MHSFAWSKTPLKMLLILILAGTINFGIILGIQMLFYPAKGPVDEDVLGQIETQWNGCEILHQKEISNTNLHIFFIKHPDGNFQLVTLRKHYLFDRYRIIDSACQPWPGGTDPIWLKAGSSQIEISIVKNTATGHYTLQELGGMTPQHAGNQFKNNMILSIAGLCGLELAIWCLVFRKEEIA